MNPASITFEGVTVRYPGVQRNAVTDISLEVGGGELVVLLGPSGCGKSTLLRTVNRLVALQDGRVLVDATDVAQLDAVELRRSVGYVIQAVGLFANMSVAQNIGVVPSLLHWSRGEIDARVDELLRLVGLDPAAYRNRRPSALSGGEAQRIGVARAIAARPRALLMDEPFGAVDVVVRTALQRELIRIVGELRTTTIFVTHDVDEAFRLADRIVVMREGRIEQAGAPFDVFQAPATPYVRQLVHAGDDVYRRYYMRTRELLRTT
ncbi:MAG TPA: ATP-binding cassette domain-containing protein [Candidatus Cybelea sp.]|nr:ATP-binding cassette domain-containing protein [Candidatus Cybelea sp.]